LKEVRYVGCEGAFHIVREIARPRWDRYEPSRHQQHGCHAQPAGAIVEIRFHICTHVSARRKIGFPRSGPSPTFVYHTCRLCCPRSSKSKSLVLRSLILRVRRWVARNVSRNFGSDLIGAVLPLSESG